MADLVNVQMEYFHRSVDEVKESWKFISFDNDIIEFTYRDKYFKVSTTNVNFIHDFSFNAMETKTDKIVGPLTPDYVDDQYIIEFATVLSYNENVIKHNYYNKFSKYNELCRQHQKKMIVIIVSPTTCYSNDDENFYDHSEMNLRYNISLSIRQYLVDNFSRNCWSQTDEVKIGRILNEILENPYIVNSKDEFERTLNFKLSKPTNLDIQNYVMLCIDKMKEKHNSLKNDKIDKTVFYENSGTRISYKRVIPLPLIVPTRNLMEYKDRFKPIFIDFQTHELKNVRYKMVHRAYNEINIIHNPDHELKIALEEAEAPIGKSKHMYRMTVKLTEEERMELAVDGVQAKQYKNRNFLLEARKIQKESFSLDCPTDDIENFILLKTLGPSSFKNTDFTLRAFDDWCDLYKDSHKVITSEYNQTTVQNDYLSILNTKIIEMADFHQALISEINYSIRENLNKDVFLVKPIPNYNADVYIKIIGSTKPIFFFISGETNYSLGLHTLGPKIQYFNEGKNFITDWSSIKLRDIENYLAISSKMMCSIAYLKQLELSEDALQSHVNYIYLLLLSNKDRDEELNTLLRYVYMRSMSLTDNVTDLTKKLPTILRSRLNVYQVNLIIKLMKRLHVNKPKIIKLEDKMDRDIKGLYDLFGHQLNFKQSLNFSYYGYIVNKQKQMETNQSSKLIDKILEFDLMVKNGDNLRGVELNELQDHYHNEKSLSILCELAKQRLINNYGLNFENIIWNKLLTQFDCIDLYTLATIKASAKMDLKDGLDEENLKHIQSRRPRVVESLKQLCDDYGIEFSHPIELVNFCLREIDLKDCFNVELFSKDQHAGIREIYVVDIRVRVIQWFLESISRVLCSLFESETMTHPSMKEYVSQKITRTAVDNLDKPMVLCRSGDASKWSQTQNVTKFYQCLTYFLPEKYHKIIKSILMLWYRKKIWLPVELIKLCLHSEKLFQNDTINFIREIYTGYNVDRRLNINQPYLRIKTGFMQGILHFTSSFFHTIVQEAFCTIKDIILKFVIKEHDSKNRLAYNIILQGSDDNSETLIVSKHHYNLAPSFFNMLVQVKDLMSYTIGIKVSVEKTASCVPFLMEYNSMWELAGKFIMPTIKFVFVSVDIPNKQTMIGRQEYYYSLLTTCIEKGSTIRTANMIRLAQAKQHYLQLGLYHNTLFFQYYLRLTRSMNPSLGYFMFEPVVLTGIIGFDFMLYWHCKYSHYINFLKLDKTIIPEGVLDKRGYRSLSDFTIAKIQFKKWSQFYNNMKLDTIEESKRILNEQPEILYGKIHDSKLEWDLINVKMTDFSIKESMGARFTKSDMFSASVYILSRQVLSSTDGKKHSILKLLEMQEVYSNTVEEIYQSFPRAHQYEKILEDLDQIINCNYFINAEYIQRGSSKIKVLESINEESYRLLDLCRCKWFGLKVLPLSETMLEKYFKQAQDNLPWLKDTEQETKTLLGCDSFTLYTYMLNTFKDSRSIVLLDTVSKAGSLNFLISRILDINKKLIHRGARFKSDVDITELEVKTNMKFLVHFPFNLDFKFNYIKPLIKKLLTFQMKKDDFIRYQVINQILDDNIDEAKRIFFNTTEDLNLTVFTKRQIFDQMIGVWTGKGLVLCKRGELIFELKIKDDYCEQILVNTYNLKNIKYKLILTCLKELKFRIPEKQGDLMHRLNLSGISVDVIGIPVKSNLGLCFNTDNIDNLSVEIEHDRIKVVTIMKPSELTKESLVNEFGLTRQALVQDRGITKWVDYNQIGNLKVKSERYSSESDLTKKLTLLSVNIRQFEFQKELNKSFPSNQLINSFWSMDMNYDKFKLIILQQVGRYDLKDVFINFCLINNLNYDCHKLFLRYIGFDRQYEPEVIEDQKSLLNDLVDESLLGFSIYDFIENIDINFQTGIQDCFDDVDMDFTNMLEGINDFIESLAFINKNYYSELQNYFIILEPIIQNICTKFYVQKGFEIRDVVDDIRLHEQLDKAEIALLYSLFNFKISQPCENIWNSNEQEFKRHVPDIIIQEPKEKVINIDNKIDDEIKKQLLIEKLSYSLQLDNHELKVEIQSVIDNLKFSIEEIDKNLKLFKPPRVKKIMQTNRQNYEDELMEHMELLKLINESKMIDLTGKLDKTNEPPIIIKEETEPEVEFLYQVHKDIDEDDYEIQPTKFYTERHIEGLNLINYFEFNVLGDGNCLFNALLLGSLQFDEYTLMIAAFNLREQISDNHKRMLIEDDSHIKGIRKDEWGCNVCANTFGALFSFKIIINSTKLTYETGNIFCRKTICLNYVNNNHFNLLIQKDKINDFINNFNLCVNNFDFLKIDLYVNQINILKCL